MPRCLGVSAMLAGATASPATRTSAPSARQRAICRFDMPRPAAMSGVKTPLVAVKAWVRISEFMLDTTTARTRVVEQGAPWCGQRGIGPDLWILAAASEPTRACPEQR